jgi:signal transduction histidine kinase
MPSMTDVFAGLALWCGFLKPTIFLVTGITSGILAGIILSMRWLLLPEERWVRYFGWAFAVFCIQYVIQAPAAWMATYGIANHAGWAQILGAAAVSTQAICSPLNNLCFLAASRTLLGRERPLPWIWVLVAFITALFTMGPQTPWYRLADSAFSVLCLLWLGWALFKNFSPLRRPELSLVNLAGAGAYGLLNVLYCLNPLLVLGGIGSSLARGIADLRRSGVVPAGSSLSPLGSLDALVFALAFGLKLLLFLGALLLIVKLLLILSPEVAREFFQDVRAKRTEYLENDGIVKALCLSVEADVAALYIHLPSRRVPEISERRWEWDAGASGRQRYLGRFLRGRRRWQSDAALRRVMDAPASNRREAFRRLPLPPADSLLGKVLRTGEEVSTHDLKEYLLRENLTHGTAESMSAVAVIPIHYHGAVIGCLDLEWRDPLGYSATALQRIRLAADWLAPAVHTRRQLVAVDRLTERLESVAIAQTDGTARKAALGTLITEVHDLLSPVETACRVDFGFRAESVVCTDSGLSFPEDSGVAPRASDGLEEKRADLKVMDPTSGEDLDTGRVVTVGEITLGLARGRDPAERPALAVDDLHRRIVAALVTGAVFDLARLELGRLHNRLQLELNSKALVSVQPWFEAVRRTACEAGLAWAVAQLPDQEPALLGHAADCALVSGLEPAEEDGQDPLLHLRLAEPSRGAWHVLRLPLPDRGGSLWLGVERPGFGTETWLPSPWRTFVRRLAISADSGLVRIEKQRGQLQAQRLQAVAIQVEMTRLLMHKLRNVTATLVGGVERLEDSLPDVGEPVGATSHERLGRLKQSAADFRDLANSILRPVPHDQRVVFPLREAVAAVRLEYEELLGAAGIELRTEVDPDLLVAGTLETVSIALSNLVVNAVEARATVISISAEVEDGHVFCEVTDNGPGIPAHLRESIFELTFTTKPDGTGIGLPLARSVIERVGGKLTLAESRKGHTRFTIRLPKADKEARHA